MSTRFIVIFYEDRAKTRTIYEGNMKKLANSLSRNTQRQFCRTHLWRLVDELEFDYLKSNPFNDELVYNYKWNMVNKILKDKLFG